MTIGRLLTNGAQDAWARRWGWSLIAAAVLLAYWPLTSFQYALTHGDTLNCWLPWRAFIGSCLQDGHFPTWNPHQQFGYPMHADLQGPAWYVEALAIGGTIGHNIYTLQALYLIYLFIGGLGMLRLIRTLYGDARIGTILGVAYALGGFFTGHQMHFYSVISAAWLPWLFDAVIRSLREPGWKNAARAAVLQGLLLTGGNHTFTIIAGYVVFALFAAHAWHHWKASGWFGVRTLTMWSIAAVLGAGLIGAGVLNAWSEVAPHIARTGGLSYEAAAAGPMTLRSLISLLFPFATGTDAAILGTDPTMANTYMGALLLPLAFAALFRKRSLVENVLLICGAICALAALGSLTPVHHWLWSFVPGMGLFRFPAYFRWFTVLAVMVLAAGSIRALATGALRHGAIVGLLACTAMVAIAIAVASFVHMQPDVQASSLFDRMRNMDLDRRVLLGAAVGVPVLLVATLLAWRRKLTFNWLLVLVLLEMGWNTSLAQWNTALSDIRPRWLYDRLSSLSTGPVIPPMVPTSTYDDNGQRLHYLAHNTQDFIGGFSRNGVNTFWLKNAMALEVEHPSLWKAMSRCPVTYLADSIVPWSGYVKEAVDPLRDSGLVVLASGSSVVVAEPRGAEDQVEIIGFNRADLTIRCKTARSALLVLQQSWYPGWEVRVDGHVMPLLKVNIAAMAVEVPAGEHEVLFRYRKPILPWLLALSLTTFFGLLLLLTWTGQGMLTKAGAWALMGLTAWSLLAHQHRLPRTEGGMNEAVHSLPNNASVVMNDDGSSPFPARGDMVGWLLRADNPLAVGEAAMVLRAAGRARTEGAPKTPREIHWIDAALKADPAVRAMILDRYAVVSSTAVEGTTDLHLIDLDQPPAWKQVYKGADSLRWVDSVSPFGSGCTIPMDSLTGFQEGTLIVDLMALAPKEAKATIVFERKLGERTTDYRALPIGVSPTWGEPVPCYAVLPMNEVYRPGEALKIYLWSHQGDSLSEQGFRVRVAPHGFYHW